MLAFRRYIRRMDQPKPPVQDEYVESERDRRLANIVLLVVFIVVAGAGVWLVNAMLDARAIDDCLAQGRRNCAPIEVPPR
jgi:hypothetical protein